MKTTQGLLIGSTINQLAKFLFLVLIWFMLLFNSSAEASWDELQWTRIYEMVLDNLAEPVFARLINEKGDFGVTM